MQDFFASTSGPKITHDMGQRQSLGGGSRIKVRAAQDDAAGMTQN
ncbi:unnamed protein product [Ixodes pacificus]